MRTLSIRVAKLLVVLVGAALLAAPALGMTANYGSVTLNPSFTALNFTDVWDLTLGDVTVSYTIDQSQVTQVAPYTTGYAEVGLRQVGAGNFNPGPFATYQGGSGGWMT